MSTTFMPNAPSRGVELGAEWIGGDVYGEDSAWLIEPQEEETILFDTGVNTGIDENGAYKGGESMMLNFKNIGNVYIIS
jgi:hypothetical protein